MAKHGIDNLTFLVDSISGPPTLHLVNQSHPAKPVSPTTGFVSHSLMGHLSRAFTSKLKNRFSSIYLPVLRANRHIHPNSAHIQDAAHIQQRQEIMETRAAQRRGMEHIRDKH